MEEFFQRKQTTKKNNIIGLADRIPNIISYVENGDFENYYHELCQNAKVDISENSEFVYFLDESFIRSSEYVYQNITPNYRLILEQGLASLLYSEDELTNEFSKRYNSVVSDTIVYVKRIIDALKLEDAFDSEKKINWFERLISDRAEHFDEAIQRILFLNQIIWQSGSTLVGLGRLDCLLESYYRQDLEGGRVTYENAYEIVLEMLRLLHVHYNLKSQALMGDTGQVIVVGGTKPDGSVYCNDLAKMFLEAVASRNEADPKIVLRVNANTSMDVMKLAVECMATGCGSPLLANDDVIIPKLQAFGIDKSDAFDYSTSACWEPLIAGKSSAMNNQGGISFLRALNDVLLNEKLDRIDSFDKLVKYYLIYLNLYINELKRGLSNQRQTRYTLYSIFVEGCRESKKDIAEGGAKYHNIGVTTVGLGNTVNSLINIKKKVFDTHELSLLDVKKAVCLNYENNEALLEELLEERPAYGTDEEDAIELTNRIMEFVSEKTKDFRTPFGGKLKFGVSSPAYMDDIATRLASFDGRKKGDPLLVHISNERADSYTSVMNFAGAIDYGENRFNGNVVDFMVNPAFISGNIEKFALLLLNGIKAGFFELQANVIGSETLVNAKKNPEKYANLVVRVWGFSAYFIELPEEYQDLLIKRAEMNERSA